MPKRTDIEHVMVIGSGPIIIGQASEFDYSGTQACRVLKAEGLRVSLVNSNPATIMTDPDVADATYIEPLTPEYVEKVIAKERPDALLATLGGQTALNIAIERTMSLKTCRSSPRLIASTSAPISWTPYFSRTPFSYSAIAMLSAVCPPRVASSASGRSLAMTFSPYSGVSGST
jgi:hypothetical protein